MQVGANKTGDPFTVLIASGVKPAPGAGVRPAQPRPGPKPEARSLTADMPTLADLRLPRAILLLDGAMGTMIQRHTLDGGRLPRRTVPQPSARAQGQQRRARPDAARRHRRHPSRIPGGRRRHHRDQHVHQHRDCAGRLRPRGARLRAEPSKARAWRGRRPTSGPHGRPTARASWPAPSGRPTARSRFRPT